MDISAIEDDIDDLEKTILSICSDTVATESACSEYVTVDNLTNSLTVRSGESRTESSVSNGQTCMSKCTDCGTERSLCLTGTEGTKTERVVNREIICDRTNYAKLIFKDKNRDHSSVCVGNKNKENEKTDEVSDDSKSPADIEKEILAFTPIKRDHRSTQMTPVAKYSHMNIMSLRKHHSTPNPHNHSTPLSQTKRNHSPDKSVTWFNRADSFSVIEIPDDTFEKSVSSFNRADSFSVIEISDDTFDKASSYSVIEIPEDPFEKTFEELLQEVTILCEEHTAKTGETGDMFDNDTESAADNQISRIDLEQLLSSPKVKIKNNIAVDGRLPLSMSQVSDPNFFNDVKQTNVCDDRSPGRFKGVDKSQHIYDESLVDDLADASEDIFGLDTFSLSDDETDDLETTVISVPQSEITLKVSEGEVSSPSTSTFSDSKVLISHVKAFVSAVVDKEIKTEKSDQDHVEKPVLESNTASSTAACSEISKEDKPPKKPTPSADVDDKKEDTLIQSSLVAERQHLLKETELMKFVKNKWKTTGIQRPDVNLTKCNRLHQAQKGRISPGLLEGEDRIPPLIRTINSYTQSGSDSAAGPDAKRRRISGIHKATVGQTTEDLIKSLKGQLDEINREWQRKQNFLHQQKLQNESEMKDKHAGVLYSLQVRQQIELQNIKHQFLYNPFLLQFRMLQLHEAHLFQRSQLRDIHRKEMEELQHKAFYKHSAEKNGYMRLSKQLNGMIKTFENKDVADIISREGTYDAVDLWKGPCRSNKLTKSLVKVCLPADIASYIMREDEIYDMLYAY